MRKMRINKINKKTWAVAIIGTILLIAGATYSMLVAVNNWFNTHQLFFAQPVVVTLNAPIKVVERKTTPEIVRIVEQIPEYEELDDIEKYICDKFGADCKVALAVARAESGMREEAFNAYNSNNTLDVGIFQVNSIWHDHDGCSLKELVVAEKNVDCAYYIWDRADGVEGNGEGAWTPWAAFNSGAFKNKL